MEWLISKLTGRVAVYACASLLGVITILLLGLAWQTSRLDDEVREHAKTTAARDSLKGDLERAATATANWKTTADGLQTRLAHANRENARIAEEGKAAVIAAERKRRAAQEELAAFKEVFSTRSASCRSALEAMEAACPELSDY